MSRFSCSFQALCELPRGRQHRGCIDVKQLGLSLRTVWKTWAMNDAPKLLRIYVNDHQAASAAGIALVQRAARNNRGTELATDLEWLRAQLAEDANALNVVARRLSVPDNPVKVQLARVGEAIGRLKLNGWIAGYSPLSRVLELEMLLAGIDAKRSLWRSLAAANRPELREVDLEGLGRRASEQRDRLLPHHSAAATGAFDRPMESEAATSRTGSSQEP